MNAPAADRLTTSLLRLRPALRHRLNEDGQILSTLPADQTLPLSDVVGMDETHRGLLVTTLHGRFLFTKQTLHANSAPTSDPAATAADTHEALAVLLIQHGAPQQSAIPLAHEVLGSVTRLTHACDHAGIRDRAALALDLLAFFQPRP